MSKYLFNGVELPALPDYDKTAYPYAVIFSTNSKYGVSPYYLVCSAGETSYSPNATARGYTPAPYLSAEMADDLSAWGEMAEGDADGRYWNNAFDHVAIWANYDMTNDEGAVTLPASEPVPVGGRHYNLLDMGGYWDDNTAEARPFEVGEMPLQYTHQQTEGTSWSMCSDPAIYMEEGPLFETATQGDKITVRYMLPAYTSNLVRKYLSLDIVGAKTDGVKREIHLDYDYSDNRLDVITEKTTGLVGKFSKLFSDVVITPITDNTDAVIGVTVQGVLQDSISTIKLVPYAEAASGSTNLCTSSITFASYDDLQITLQNATEGGGEPDPDEPESVLAWQKHDAYKPNTKWDGNTFYRVMGGKWVKQDAMNPSLVEVEPDVPEPDEPTGEPIAYLYNGVRLPDINEVWTDKLTYPQAYIIDGAGTADYFMLHCTNKPYAKAQNDNAVGTEEEHAYSWFMCALDQELADAYGLSIGVWTFFNSGVENGYNNLPPLWCSRDILNTDGSVYLAASEPVPVYE